MSPYVYQVIYIMGGMGVYAKPVIYLGDNVYLYRPSHVISTT